jgi:hypothetical protein
MFLIKRLEGMTKGGIAGLLAVLALAGVAAFVWVARTVNTAPAQCASCHLELTAMWKRSQGHPADRVTCYQCHAQHAQLPESPNLGAFVRDQLIPEKYLSSDERINARCEGCHQGIRASGTGMGVLWAKAALRSGVAALADAPEDERLAVVPRDALGDPSRPVRGGDVGAAAVRSLRDREWAEAARAANGDRAGEVLASLRADLEAVVQALGSAGVTAEEIGRRKAERLGERLTQIDDAAGRIAGFLARAEEVLAGAPSEAPVAPGLAGEVRGLLGEATGVLGEIVRARITVGRALGSEQAVADPAGLRAQLAAVGRALDEATAQAAREAAAAARAAFAAPLPNQEVIAARIAALSQEGEARLAAAGARFLAASRGVLGDLPVGAPPAPSPGARARVVGGALVPLPATPGRSAPAEAPPPALGPAALAAELQAGVASLATAVEAVGEVQYGDLGLDDARIAGLSERLAQVAGAFSGREGPGAVRAALRRHLEESLRFLGPIEAEDGRRLELAVETPEAAAGLPAIALDLGELLPAALAPFEGLERALEQRQVIQANHKVHLVAARDELGRPLNLGCVDCHRNIAHDKAQIETNRPPMAGCFAGQCHQKDRNKDNCRRCHFQHLAEPGQEVL